MTRGNYECNKRLCVNCNQNRKVVHLCYMSPLKNVLPAGLKLLYVFHDFESTQNAKYSDKTMLHVPNLICSSCEYLEEVERGCFQCGKRKHSFWDDLEGDMMSYLCEPRHWDNKIVAVAHNAKAFVLRFTINIPSFRNDKPEISMNGVKTLCKKMEHLVFLDSVSYFRVRYVSRPWRSV